MQHHLLWIMPALVGAGLLEALLWRRLRGRRYPWGEGLASIGIAIGQGAKRLLVGGLVLGLFMAVWEFRPWTVPLDTLWGLALLLVAVEFVYYWHHRLHHRVRWFWATHAVHHSPNHLTFLTAVRLGWTSEVSGGFIPFLALPLLGFHPLAVFAALALNLLYQFWIHTETVPRLGWLEGVLNTPSNHRVHHASNARYLDRNFGGMLVVFDRIFGTYAAEAPEEPCRYGLTTPLHSANPVTIAFHEWRAMLADACRARGWKDRLRVLFGPPGSSPGTP
jgi:sterol desaturase/sphingolipid hydroxylase (fatty acid hydroxylase superfamily)